MARALLLGPPGLPCSPPPWGELVAVEPASGRIIWPRTVESMKDVFGGAIRADEGSPILGRQS